MLLGRASVVGFSGRSHRLVEGSRGPSRRILLSWRMRQRSRENWTSQPLSQNFAIERREWDARPGSIWALVLLGGRDGRFKVQVWLDWMPAPFGMWTVMGWGSGWRSRCGLDGLR